MAKQEVWLTCADICGFVKKRGPVLHGCPYCKPRQVVHDDSSDTFIQFVDFSRLADKFIQCLQSMAQEATSGDCAKCDKRKPRWTKPKMPTMEKPLSQLPNQKLPILWRKARAPRWMRKWRETTHLMVAIVTKHLVQIRQT